jgi:phosphoglycerate kinase
MARDLYNNNQDQIKLPVDHIAAMAFDNEADHQIVTGDIPEGMMGLDIGPATIAAYSKLLREAKTIIWNGPMGVFEMPNYAKGTLAIAETLAEVTPSGTLTVVGGGDSVAAITQAELNDDVSHVSTGGGAMLEFLEGKTLPGVAALTQTNG